MSFFRVEQLVAVVQWEEVTPCCDLYSLFFRRKAANHSTAFSEVGGRSWKYDNVTVQHLPIIYKYVWQILTYFSENGKSLQQKRNDSFVQILPRRQRAKLNVLFWCDFLLWISYNHVLTHSSITIIELGLFNKDIYYFLYRNIRIFRKYKNDFGQYKNRMIFLN